MNLAKEGRGDWFLTHTGLQFFPLDPYTNDVCIEDIAHALSHICRFGGHCNSFYSVAQHSVLVSYIVDAEIAREGLLHDATEAYLGDMVRPLKVQMPEYQRVEENLTLIVERKFDLHCSPEIYAAVKAADNIALMTERRDLCPRSVHRWSVTAIPIAERIHPLGPESARFQFMERYKELFCAS